LTFLAAGIAHAQNCPTVDPAEQKANEEQCRAAGGEWARFGVHAHLCSIYSCAARTKDAGKPCRNRLDCEHLCVTAKELWPFFQKKGPDPFSLELENPLCVGAPHLMPDLIG
jgi:hypothetical protein